MEESAEEEGILQEEVEIFQSFTVLSIYEKKFKLVIEME